MPRPGLITRLRDATSVPVIAIVAPPGYGKTTILAEWASSDPRPFGWLWIDHRHRDPAVVLACIAAVLAEVIPVEPSVFDDLGIAHRPQRDAATTKFAASAAGSPHPFVLVLDDAHLLTDQETLTAVQTVIEHLPDGCQLAFAGRREPELGLPRLRSEGRVLDIRASCVCRPGRLRT